MKEDNKKPAKDRKPTAKLHQYQIRYEFHVSNIVLGDFKIYTQNNNNST